MKTIEQAAQEYAEKHTLKAGADRTKRENAFKAGVEFAQRWISTEDELPENIDSEVYYLVKYDNGRVYLAAAYRNNLFWSQTWVQMKNIKFWRRIELN